MSDLAQRQIKAISSDYVRNEIIDEIATLHDDPYPLGSQLEDALLHRHRLKINGWRIIYKVDEEDRLITILTVRKRNRNTYLNVPKRSLNLTQSPFYPKRIALNCSK